MTGNQTTNQLNNFANKINKTIKLSFMFFFLKNDETRTDICWEKVARKGRNNRGENMEA